MGSLDFGEWIVLGMVAAIGYVIVKGMKSRDATDTAMVCKTCECLGVPRRHTKGSLLIEIVLWLCFIIPGLIYSIWRLNTRGDVCASCGSAELVPADSPAGKRIAAAVTNAPPRT